MAFVRIAGADSLAPRLASAAIGIPVLLLFIWLGSFWFTALVVIAAVVGLLEFHRLTDLKNLWLQRAPGLVLAVLLVINGHQETVWAAPLVLGGLLMLLVSHIGTPQNARPLLLTVAGPLYLGATLAYAVLLRRLDHGVQWVLTALLATFAVDTAAYFIGRVMGRHHMVPRISPGKTWEGAVAGLVAGVVVTLLLTVALDLPLEIWEALVLGVGIGLVAQAGDLLESALKRAAKAKEAGWLIPGHGGVLDRLDSIVFNLVLVYYGAIWAAP